MFSERFQNRVEHRFLFCGICVTVTWCGNICDLGWGRVPRHCDYYCGLLPTFTIQESTEFQCDVSENETNFSCHRDI